MFPRNLLHQTLSCAFIVLCFLSLGCASKQKGVITEQQVSAFLEKMDKAARAKDVEGMLACLSKNVQMKVTIEGFGPTQTMVLNRDQFRDYSKQGVGAIQAYDLRRGKTVIKVEPDGQSAFVAGDVYETTTIGGRVIRTVTRGTATLKLENGNLVVTSSEETGRPLKPSETAQLN